MKWPITIGNRHIAVEVTKDPGLIGMHWHIRLYTQRRIRSLFVSTYNMDRPD